MAKSGNSQFSRLFTTLMSTLFVSSLLSSCWVQSSIFASVNPLYEVSPPEPTYKASKSEPNIHHLDGNTYRIEFDEVNQVINVTVVDYAYPPIESPTETPPIPIPRALVDNCGDGSTEFVTNGGVRWMNFPVSYAVDPTNSGVSAAAATNAMTAAFNEFDLYISGQAFVLTSNYNSADIKIRWQFIDGQFGV
ncbi:MAG: hypothetical protein ACRD5B_15655, partial [Nitrososphaeraceae archaeon]